jgi:hypothetical protein
VFFPEMPRVSFHFSVAGLLLMLFRHSFLHATGPGRNSPKMVAGSPRLTG